MGRIGEAQIGPFYLGRLGLASLFLGFLAFEIIGLNMWASVGWDPVQFLRQLPWLALEPPAPKYGLQILPPLAEGGWWLIAGFFLTASVLLWWARTFIRARQLGLGTHTAWAFASAIFLFLSLGFIRPVLMGSWSEAVPVRHLPAPRLDRGILDPLRQPVLQPVPLPLDRLPLRLDPAVRDARRRRSCRSGATAVSASSSRSSTAALRQNAPGCSGAGRWGSTPVMNRYIAGPGGSRC